MLRSASNNSGAAQAGLPAAVGIGSYPVMVEGEDIKVEIG